MSPESIVVVVVLLVLMIGVGKLAVRVRESTIQADAARNDVARLRKDHHTLADGYLDLVDRHNALCDDVLDNTDTIESLQRKVSRHRKTVLNHRKKAIIQFRQVWEQVGEVATDVDAVVEAQNTNALILAGLATFVGSNAVCDDCAGKDAASAPYQA